MRTWALLLVVACSSGEPDPAPRAFVADASPAGEAASRSVRKEDSRPRVGPGEHAGVTSAVVPAPLGVDACDRFARAYAECITKLPDAERGPASEALASMMSAWRVTLAADPSARDAIARGCGEALAAERRAAKTRCPGVSFDAP